MLARTQSEHALNIHEVPQQKLPSAAAQRILNILEKCINQVETVSALSAVRQLDSMSSVADKELSEALQEHQMLDERLETLQRLNEESGGEQEGEDEARKRATLQLEKDIKNSVRDLLRFFRTHPDASFGLKALQGMEIGEGECNLISGLKVFHSHMVERLLTSPNEELQLSLSKQMSSSCAHNLEHMISLEERADAAVKQIDSLISQKQNEIKHLQSSLQQNNTGEVGKSLPTDKQFQPQVKTSKKQASIQQEIDQLKIQLNNLTLENRQAERVLLEKNEKVENKIYYLVQHFDNKMKEIQADLELNERENEREEEEMQRLEVPFSVLKVEYDQILERRRLAEEKRKEEMKVLQLKTKAAIFAQAWWRGYSVRKTLKNKGKNKKAKKGKGKKK